MKRSALLALCALLAAGCGGPVSLRVKTRLVKALPVESRIDLLDAENAMFASIDNLDEARDELEQAEAEYDAAGDRISEAKDQRSKARDAKDQAAVDIAELAIAEAKARKVFLKEQLKVLRARVRLREAELDVARGRHELAKAQAVRKVNLEGAEKLKPEEFEAQVARLEERAKKRQEELEAMASAADEQRKAWADSRAALAKATGGAQGSTWVE